MILNFTFQNDFFTKKNVLTFVKLTENTMKTYFYKDVVEDGEIIDVELYKTLLFVGDNNSGKTNLLTAIKFCLLVINDNLSNENQLFVDNYIKNNNFNYILDYMFNNEILTIEYNCVNSNFEIKKPINKLNLFVRDDFNLDLINNIKNINNSLILNDCQDGHIHFLRLMEALNRIEDSTSNQLILATHNPSWLDNNKYFSEEQIYFITKQEVYALSDFDLTKINEKGINYRDAYLHDRFGAVPDLDDIKW